MQPEHHNQAVSLTQEQIEEIASRAADKAIERITQHIYQQSDNSVINKIIWSLSGNKLMEY